MYSTTLKVSGKIVDIRYSRTEFGVVWDGIMLMRKLRAILGPQATYTKSLSGTTVYAWRDGVCVAEIIVEDVPKCNADVTPFSYRSLFA